MRIIDLKYFIDVAENGSLTQAAELRGMSQPGLSRIIREIEKRLNSRLLKRTGRGIELTPAGERFLLFAQQTIVGFEETRTAITTIDSDKPTYIRIAIPIILGGLLVANLQREFALKLPHIGIDVFEVSTARMTDAMLMRRYQTALTYGYDQHRTKHSSDLYFEDLLLVGKKDSMEDADTVITLAEVAHVPLILPPSGHYRALINTGFESAGLVPKVALEFETIEAILAYVMERKGIAILPRSHLAYTRNEHLFKTRLIVEPMLTRKVRFLSSRSQTVNGYQQILDILLTQLEAIAPRVGWRRIDPLSSKD